MSQLASIGTALSLAAAALPALSPNKAEAAALPSVRPDEILVRDNASSLSFLGNVDFSNFFQTRPDNSTIGAASFVGNGEVISRVGGFFSKYSDNGNPNGGSWSNYTFRINFYDSPQRFLADPFLLSPTSADRALAFATPTNPNWSTPVTTINGNQVFYFEFDLSGRGIRTTAGREQLLAINPDSSSVLGSSTQWLGRSGNISGDDYFGTLKRGGTVGTFREMNAPFSSSASFATTLPEPTSTGLFVIGFGALAGTTRLRRRDP